MTMDKEQIVLFGATGNLGLQCLDVIREHSDRFEVVGMSAGSNRILLAKLLEEFDEAVGFLATASLPEADGFAPTRADLVDVNTDIVMFLEGGLGCKDALLKAISMKKKILIANKELLVAFGEDISYLAREMQVDLIPIDSELNAVFQALQGEQQRDVRRVILTASGGALRDRAWPDCGDVTAEEVLLHPTWKMGKKITVDSATLVNKAFEVIETHYLFNIPFDQIEVRLHSTSTIHAIVEFVDGFSKMVVSNPDMKQAIRSALLFPGRPECSGDRFEFDRALDLDKLERGRFPCFDWVLEVAKHRPGELAELVDLDEAAVESFLCGELSYHGILDRLLEVGRGEPRAESRETFGREAGVLYTSDNAV
jgi:1-deoxy-D-xylulose-5-phosphate reductoisomerase